MRCHEHNTTVTKLCLRVSNHWDARARSSAGKARSQAAAAAAATATATATTPSTNTNHTHKRSGKASENPLQTQRSPPHWRGVTPTASQPPPPRQVTNLPQWCLCLVTVLKGLRQEKHACAAWNSFLQPSRPEASPFLRPSARRLTDDFLSNDWSIDRSVRITSHPTGIGDSDDETLPHKKKT